MSNEAEWAQAVRDALLRAFHSYDEEGGPLSPLVVKALDAVGAQIVPTQATQAMAAGLHRSIGNHDEDGFAAWSAMLAAAPGLTRGGAA